MATLAPPKVQHVTKASSDELLHKFSELGSKQSKKMELQVVKKQKRSRIEHSNDGNESPLKNGVNFVERRSLLPRGTRRSALLRQFGMRGVSLARSRDVKNKSVFRTIEKTWRKTIEGASKVFIESHYYRRKRLCELCVGFCRNLCLQL